MDKQTTDSGDTRERYILIIHEAMPGPHETDLGINAEY
jgi:hypothetical protein